MNYWEERYLNSNTGWDIGYPTPAIIEYFKEKDKTSKILIPGCGNAYEAEYLFNQGFKNIVLIDIAKSPLDNFKKRLPEFPKDQLICDDFFNLSLEFDYIIEQTFFCAIDPSFRNKYAKKAHELLAPNGILIGLLWSVELNNNQPPYGGSKKEYDEYFQNLFNYLHFEDSLASIPQRMGREFFIELKKK